MHIKHNASFYKTQYTLRQYSNCVQSCKNTSLVSATCSRSTVLRITDFSLQWFPHSCTIETAFWILVLSTVNSVGDRVKSGHSKSLNSGCPLGSCSAKKPCTRQRVRPDLSWIVVSSWPYLNWDKRWNHNKKQHKDFFLPHRMEGAIRHNLPNGPALNSWRWLLCTLVRCHPYCPGVWWHYREFRAVAVLESSRQLR